MKTIKAIGLTSLYTVCLALFILEPFLKSINCYGMQTHEYSKCARMLVCIIALFVLAIFSAYKLIYNWLK